MLRSFFNRWLLHPLYRWEIVIGIAMEFVLCVCVLNLLYRWEKAIWVIFWMFGAGEEFLHAFLYLYKRLVCPSIGWSVGLSVIILLKHKKFNS